MLTPGAPKSRARRRLSPVQSGRAAKEAVLAALQDYGVALLNAADVADQVEGQVVECVTAQEDEVHAWLHAQLEARN